MPRLRLASARLHHGYRAFSHISSGDACLEQPLERMTDSLRDLALFVEVVNARSLKRGGEALGIPHSTVSRRIATLEKAIGVRLLHRTTRTLTLTEAGRIYFERCREIVKAARVAHEEIRDVVLRPRGRLRVSTTVEFARLFLGELVADFARQYPDLSIDVDLQPHKVDLYEDNFDLALRIGHPPDSSLVARQLGCIRVALYASPSYLAGNGAPDSPTDLQRYAFIGNLNSPTPGTLTLHDGNADETVTVSTRLMVNNFGFMRELAVLGLGVTVLHEPMVTGDIKAGRLTRVLPAWCAQETPVYALTPSRLLPAKTRLFLDMLTKRVSPKMAAAFAPRSAKRKPS
jgi:DNA-binding transcriptional LysR family regulator